MEIMIKNINLSINVSVKLYSFTWQNCYYYTGVNRVKYTVTLELSKDGEVVLKTVDFDENPYCQTDYILDCAISKLELKLDNL